MAGNVADGAEQAANSVGLFTGEAANPSVRLIGPTSVTLSGTVVVEFEVAVEDGERGSGHHVVRVVFPDELRSMLEASTWIRGTSIREVVSRLGADFIDRYGAKGLRALLAVELTGRTPTFHIPLSYVRACLPGVGASIA